MERTNLLMFQILCIAIASCKWNYSGSWGDRRGLKTFTDWKCLNIDFGHEDCADVLNSMNIDTPSDHKFPELNDVLDTSHFDDISANLGAYYCCAIQKSTWFDLYALADDFSTWCSKNVHILSNMDHIATKCSSNGDDCSWFIMLGSYCPASVLNGKQSSLSFVTAIQPAVVENQDLTSPSVLEQPECSAKTEGNAEFTLALVNTSGFSVGHLVAWTDDSHFYAWYTHEDEESTGVDLILPTTGSAQKRFKFEVEKKITFKGVNQEAIDLAWKKFISHRSYSLATRNCVHATVAIMKEILDCKWTQNPVFPTPKDAFAEIQKAAELSGIQYTLVKSSQKSKQKK